MTTRLALVASCLLALSACTPECADVYVKTVCRRALFSDEAVCELHRSCITRPPLPECQYEKFSARGKEVLVATNQPCLQ